MPLTDAACRNAKPSEKPRKMSDGGGLFLVVQPTGSKLWRQQYRFQGKFKLLSHGAYPSVTLLEARKKRDDAKALLAKNIDPGDHQKSAKRQARIAAVNTFEAVAKEWFENKERGWSPAYSTRLWRRLKADIIPKIGNRPISEIDPAEVLEAIRKIEKRNAVVLAGRLLQVCGQIFRYAVATQRAKSDPTRDLRGALRSRGPAQHRSALKAAELGPFLRSLAEYPGDEQTALALRLVVHTMVRTGETRFAVWSEFELDGKAPLWRIPAKRMKMRNEHVVPLTPQVLDLLGEFKKLAGNSRFVLPSATKESVISQNTLIYALYRLGYHSRAHCPRFPRHSQHGPERARLQSRLDRAPACPRGTQ